MRRDAFVGEVFIVCYPRRSFVARGVSSRRWLAPLRAFPLSSSSSRRSRGGRDARFRKGLWPRARGIGFPGTATAEFTLRASAAAAAITAASTSSTASTATAALLRGRRRCRASVASAAAAVRSLPGDVRARAESVRNSADADRTLTLRVLPRLDLRQGMRLRGGLREPAAEMHLPEQSVHAAAAARSRPGRAASDAKQRRNGRERTDAPDPDAE